MHLTDTESRNNDRASEPRHTYPEHVDSGYYTIKQVVDFVPVFDGYYITVLLFVRACKRARCVVPASAEWTLTKLLCNKLRGRAYAAIEGSSCDTVSQLCNRVKDGLGPYKFLDEYRGELARVYQGKSDHILEYITRVRDLRAAIVPAIGPVHHRRLHSWADPRSASRDMSLSRRPVRDNFR